MTFFNFDYFKEKEQWNTKFKKIFISDLQVKLQEDTNHQENIYNSLEYNMLGKKYRIINNI